MEKIYRLNCNSLASDTGLLERRVKQRLKIKNKIKKFCTSENLNGHANVCTNGLVKFSCVLSRQSTDELRAFEGASVSAALKRSSRLPSRAASVADGKKAEEYRAPGAHPGSTVPESIHRPGLA